MKEFIKNNILASVALLLASVFSLPLYAAEQDCSRYTERLDELKLFMRQSPTAEQKAYFQHRYQELMGGKLFCEQGSEFEVPEVEQAATLPAPQKTQKPVATEKNINPVKPENDWADKSQQHNALDENVTPIFSDNNKRPEQKKIVKLSPKKPVSENDQKQNQQLVIVEPESATEKDTPRLPPGLTKQQYYQSLCKLARDTYADEPTERNRKKVARFCE